MALSVLVKRVHKLERGTTIIAPLDIPVVTPDFLSALEPESHLDILVLTVRCAVRLLGQVDMEPFGVLGVEVISSSEQFNEEAVMAHEMKLRQVKI